MIGIKLSGGLGNNMFQYASGHSLASSKNLRFCYFSQKDLSFYIKRIKKNILSIFFGEKDLFQKQLSQRDLCEYFTLDQNKYILLIYRIIWLLKKRKRVFTYKLKAGKSFSREIIKDFYNCKDWTLLVGGFPSELFFTNRKRILDWFTPREFYRKKIDDIEKKFTYPSHQRCCIHIRRGDYLFMDKGFALNDIGWSLPLEYYKYILKKLDKNMLFIFISDDIDWALNNFDFLPNKIFMRDNPEVVDLFIFSKCKYNILSRSTFSWWGAWLNQIPERIVYAPKYFIGIPQKICVPPGLDEGREVNNWRYIDFEEAC
ncbi:MAG: hypothetical protein CMK49_01085 [Prochlorococcus sp. SP3034]|nr:hypothetical protein [Prochlorococcus sp. SP3034]|tara:strand:+ start:4378 stop:5322 length:945 start_codon:yes stop_codon:yes gene_type:complete